MQGHAHWLTPFFYVGLKGHMCQMKMYLVWSSSLFFPIVQLLTWSSSIILTIFIFIILKMIFQFLLWLLPLCSANSSLFHPAVFVAAASFLNPETAMKSWVDIHTSLCFFTYLTTVNHGSADHAPKYLVVILTRSTSVLSLSLRLLSPSLSWRTNPIN